MSLLSVTVSGCTVWLQPTLLLQWRVWCLPTQVQACPLILHSAVSLRHDKGQTETWPSRAVLCRGEPGKCSGFAPFFSVFKKRQPTWGWTQTVFLMWAVWTFEKHKQAKNGQCRNEWKCLGNRMGVFFILWKILYHKKLLEKYLLFFFYNIWILGLPCAYIWCLFCQGLQLICIIN